MSNHLMIYCVSAFVGLLIIASTAWRDYHAYPIKYDCELLVINRHTSMPPEVIEKCKKKGYPYASSKTRN